MNEAAATCVDAYVRELVLGNGKKEQVAGSQSGYLHSFALEVLFSRGTRNLYAGLAISIVHQATTVESPGTRAAITVGRANHVTCDSKSAVGTYLWFVWRLNYDGGFGS